MSKKAILIIVAHSDDETIGMGGTIKKHINNNDEVYVVSMTNGIGSRDNINNSDLLKRQNSAKLASKYLGFKWLDNFNFEDNAMDKYALLEIVKCIEQVKKNIDPDLVYTHTSTDMNIDHKIVSNAVLIAFRPQPNENCREIRFFEVPSATDYGNESIVNKFSPNLYVNIKDTWDFKEQAMIAYETELRDYPHSRSILGIKNLACLRGNQVGLYMSESFQVIRKIQY